MQKRVEKNRCETCKRPYKITKVAIIGALKQTTSICPNGHTEIRYRLAEIG